MSVDHLFMADACVTCQHSSRVPTDAFNMNTANIRAVPSVLFVGLLYLARVVSQMMSSHPVEITPNTIN